MSHLRVATFNIRHGRPTAGPADIASLARTCTLLGADLLALQEVDKRMRRSRWTDQPARLARRTGMAYAFGPALRSGWFGRYGNTLLVRGTLSAVQELELPSGAGEPRAALLATAEIDGRSLSVVTTHLSVQAGERDRQLAAVLDALSGRPLPQLLLGDLNGTPEDVATLIEAAELHLVRAAPTFPSDAPRMQIDHVAHAGLDFVGWQVPDTAASDHRPLIVELS